MDQPAEPTQPPEQSPQRVSLSPPAEQVPVSDIYSAWPTKPRQPTFQELMGTRLASGVLVVICTLTVVFLFVWWFTRPSVEEIRTILGNDVNGKELLEALRNLRTDHFNELRDLFQLLVVSSLVPLFTLLAGYSFGARQKQE